MAVRLGPLWEKILLVVGVVDAVLRDVAVPVRLLLAGCEWGEELRVRGVQILGGRVRRSDGLWVSEAVQVSLFRLVQGGMSRVLVDGIGHV